MQQTISKANPSVNPVSSAVDVAVYGEVLYDCFPDGRRVLGGAPFNVAWGLKGFGHDPLFMSAVGDDPGGHNIREKMSTWGLSTDGLQTHADYATGEVQVTIENDEPSYEICEPRAWDFIDESDVSASKLIYHGLLALRNPHSRASFQALMRNSSAMRFFDVNLRPPYYELGSLRAQIEGADWLKLNIDELEIVLGESSIIFDRSEASVERLIAQFGVKNVLLTGGSQGAFIYGEYGKAMCTPAPVPDPLVDTVGAGDSFSAFTIHGIVSQLPVEAIVQNASHFAAKVCGMQGATTTDKTFYSTSNKS